MPSTSVPGTGGSHIVIGGFRDFIVNVNLQGSEILRERFSQTFELGFLAFLRMGVSATRPSALEILNRITT